MVLCSKCQNFISILSQCTYFNSTFPPMFCHSIENLFACILLRYFRGGGILLVVSGAGGCCLLFQGRGGCCLLFQGWGDVACCFRAGMLLVVSGAGWCCLLFQGRGMLLVVSGTGGCCLFRGGEMLLVVSGAGGVALTLCNQFVNSLGPIIKKNAANSSAGIILVVREKNTVGPQNHRTASSL